MNLSRITEKIINTLQDKVTLTVYEVDEYTDDGPVLAIKVTKHDCLGEQYLEQWLSIPDLAPYVIPHEKQATWKGSTDYI